MKIKIYSCLCFVFLTVFVLGIIIICNSASWAFEYADNYSVFEVVKENYAGYRDFKLSELNTYRECLTYQRCSLGAVIAMVGGFSLLHAVNSIVKILLGKRVASKQYNN